MSKQLTPFQKRLLEYACAGVRGGRLDPKLMGAIAAVLNTNVSNLSRSIRLLVARGFLAPAKLDHPMGESWGFKYVFLVTPSGREALDE
jgi:hypothetical protein